MIKYASNACERGLELRAQVAAASATPASSSITTTSRFGMQRPISIVTTSADSEMRQPSQGSIVPIVSRPTESDSRITYPLPINLAETHRQSLRTLLTTQLFEGPIISSVFNEHRPPTRVLEVACGSAVWSMMCSRYFARHGHSAISFTGIDIVPQAHPEHVKKTGLGNNLRWRFVQHDIRKFPWPFLDGEFDLIMAKDVSLCVPSRDYQGLFEEYVRLLRPAGVLEVWDTDSTIRLIRPGPIPQPGVVNLGNNPKSEKYLAHKHAVYGVNSNTSLSPPVNLHLVKYNVWVSDALNRRGLSPAPCTQIEACLLQESDSLKDVSTVRLAVPLSDIRWERNRMDNLSLAQESLRKIALEATTGLILSLKPVLREVNSMNPDEWDTWYFRMVNDLLNEGTGWGECLEVGAWTARKR
ncbi:S-adenosyl-L-methionine-dependent methyltransferase [Xylariaceae sp. FL0255]|nr:S-adenosyl-L-methionine-dependent methyltransferase [Xylariaceae sp. FL0255]